MSIEQFHAKPKTVTETYRGITIQANYDPDKKLWHWKFEIPAHVITVEADSISLNAALREAKKQVDVVNGGL